MLIFNHGKFYPDALLQSHTNCRKHYMTFFRLSISDVSGYLLMTRLCSSLLSFCFFSEILFIFPNFNKKHNKWVVYPKYIMKRGLFGPVYLSTDEKYDSKSGKTNNKWPQVGYVACDRISFFWNANKNLRVARKN